MLYEIALVIGIIGGGIIGFLLSWLETSSSTRKYRGESIIEFRCCFEKCKCKSQSLLFILGHMQGEHKLRIGKDVFQYESETEEGQ